MKSWKLWLTLLVTATAVSCTSDRPSGLQNRNIFQYNLRTEPTKLNPITSSDLTASMVELYMVDRLLDRHPDTMEWMPMLAESYEVGADGQTFTFKIRQGVKFHDGQPVTAEDVKFSYDAFFIDEYGAFRMRPYFESSFGNLKKISS